MKRKGQTTYEGMSLGVTPPTADLYRSTRSLCEPRAGSSEAQFGVLCKGCPLRDKCTESKAGRTVYIHPKHRVLERSRRRQREPGWRARYRGTRPKVERKLAPMMRRKHGGRRATWLAWRCSACAATPPRPAELGGSPRSVASASLALNCRRVVYFGRNRASARRPSEEYLGWCTAKALKQHACRMPSSHRRRRRALLRVSST